MDFLQSIDLLIFYAVNGLARLYGPVDEFVMFIAGNALFKGLPIMLLIWGLWFYGSATLGWSRAKLASTLVVGFVAIFVGRILAVALPFRLRPLHTPDLDYVLPYGLPSTTMEGWSSLPSDHAVLFFALSTGIFLVNRWAGALALVHAVVIVSLPRIYVGLHFPSDILAGAIVGIVMSLVLVPPLARALTRQQAIERALASPHILYPSLFLVTYQCATMFESARAAIPMAVRLVTAALD